MQATQFRSNRSIFVPRDSGSPKDGLMSHISSLGRLGRLDFERFDVAGEVIFKVEGDLLPTSREDEEARVATLAHALKVLGDATDAAEFMRCLNAICDGGDALSRQAAASHYYREIGARGTAGVLKEMALLAMQLGQLGAAEIISEEVVELSGAAADLDSRSVLALRAEERSERGGSLFERELESVARLVGGRRKASRPARDDFAAMVDDLEAGGASVEELDAAFETLEALDQYDENGAIIFMSGHERTTPCGRLESELSAEDIPEQAQHLAADVCRHYANGVGVEAIWDDVDAQLEVIFPVKGRAAGGGRFYSHANRELQALTREVLAAVLADCRADAHLNALRHGKGYREFHKAVRRATDTKEVGEVMKRAYEERQRGALPLKHFTILTTAAHLQRARLESARLSRSAHALLREIAGASDGKLRYLRWAMYGANQPRHVIHTLPAQERARVWNALKARRGSAGVAAGVPQAA
jgi:hypothetical protein